MKKLLLLAISLFVLTGCQPNDTVIHQTAATFLFADGVAAEEPSDGFLKLDGISSEDAAVEVTITKSDDSFFKSLQAEPASDGLNFTLPELQDGLYVLKADVKSGQEWLQPSVQLAIGELSEEEQAAAVKPGTVTIDHAGHGHHH